MPAVTPDLPPHAALLLDLDGTLIDIAPTPDSVVVPQDLRLSLSCLRVALNNAVAVVTGRPIEQVDHLLGDLPYAVAGEHGGAIRHAPGEPIVRAPLAEPPPEWIRAAERAAAAQPGVLLERKARGFVLHYRLAPAAGAAMEAVMRALIAGEEARFTILPALMAWELKPRGADKATAVRALMARPPFAGRTPVYIGDDVTDEDGMRAARDLGGIGWRVPEVFADASGVRAWLAQIG